MTILNQIKSIELKIKQGKINNVYAAKNKLSQLKSKLAAQQKAMYWFEWLAK